MSVRTKSLREAIEDAAVRKRESQIVCPAHEDNMPSLHVVPGRVQPVVMTCHAGCTLDAILAAEGLDLQAVLNEAAPDDGRAGHGENKWTPAGEASHVYKYVDEQGSLLFETMRVPLPGGKKTFRQRQPNPDYDSSLPRDKNDVRTKEFLWTLEGARRVLYRLPEVIAAVQEGQVVHVVEGEKDAESLRALGLVATTSPMGAGKWLPEYSEVLRGAFVIIISDADEAGRKHSRMVRDMLKEVGATVNVMEPATGYKDVTDHLTAGLSLDDLLETAPDPEDGTQSHSGVDVLDLVKRTVKPATFVIPNVLAEGDRWLMTGFEGHGKSMLLRQLAVQAAAGIHPFTGKLFEPQRVLVIDSENHPDQVIEPWQNLVGLCARHNAPLERGMLTILEEWDTDIDLTTPDGREWLVERVRAFRPRLMTIGPLYTMSGRDLKDDETVRKIKSAVNEARAICGTAIVMEHHAPHKGPGDSKRSVRPYGSSTFLKFPEFGHGLQPTETEGAYEFIKTRMPRVRTRQFPEYMRWGKANTDEWPWMPAEMLADGTFV